MPHHGFSRKKNETVKIKTYTKNNKITIKTYVGWGCIGRYAFESHKAIIKNNIYNYLKNNNLKCVFIFIIFYCSRWCKKAYLVQVHLEKLRSFIQLTVSNSEHFDSTATLKAFFFQLLSLIQSEITLQSWVLFNF